MCWKMKVELGNRIHGEVGFQQPERLFNQEGDQMALLSKIEGSAGPDVFDTFPAGFGRWQVARPPSTEESTKNVLESSSSPAPRICRSAL